MYAGVRAVVFGATGFIGRWVAKALSDRECCVFTFVRDTAKAEEIFDRYGICAEIVEADVLTSADWLRLALEKIRPAITFNLAGYGVRRGERDEETAYRVNSRFVTHLCDVTARTSCADWEGQALVHAGSALEYGDVAGHLSEESITNPTTVYGKSKLEGTRRVTRLYQTRGRGLAARLFTVYGPGEAPERLLPSLIRAASAGDPLELTEGLQQRDFTYVEDVAEGILKLGLSRSPDWPVVNLATGRLASVKTFALTAARLLGLGKERLHFGAIPTRPEEMQHAPVATNRLIKMTGWVPSTTIEAGISKTLGLESLCERDGPCRS